MEYKTLIDVVGWAGSILVVAAYISVSYERLKLSPRLFQLLNAGGSICLIANTIYYQAYPSAAVNVIWLFIALVSLGRMSANKSL
ncbi:hypothetical protein GXP67_32315 [Rhodocytophaga rosea]|uniref:CBU-0592-like domain-containing protein n=1 Tax=Rhodocytophaga rosea TaxID=2704465 RepID=A0A6C0GTX5_9BACT|nr:hypothetical protein [Rhodocytophaga rosea]QHT71003.1 hypothetical protein GXP67_32315 [Rhodocytophaga rosea]